jgi:alkylation response protein AidB-like acyl-CoA dehydrogenase
MICTGIEHKMGLKGNATSSLSFGDNGKCVGYLLGKEREGMKVMFMLMNAARIHTGVQAEAVSSAAYMHAVTYARNRIQGDQPDAERRRKSPIIEHHRRKTHAALHEEHRRGMRMLTLFSGHS